MWCLDVINFVFCIRFEFRYVNFVWCDFIEIGNFFCCLCVERFIKIIVIDFC